MASSYLNRSGKGATELKRRSWELAIGAVLVLMAGWGAGVLLSPATRSADVELPEHWYLLWGQVRDEQTGEPVAATITINGRLVAAGVSQFAHIVVQGRTRLEVSAPGYADWTKTITGGWEENGRAVGGPVQLKRLGSQAGR